MKPQHFDCALSFTSVSVLTCHSTPTAFARGVCQLQNLTLQKKKLKKWDHLMLSLRPAQRRGLKENLVPTDQRALRYIHQLVEAPTTIQVPAHLLAHLPLNIFLEASGTPHPSCVLLSEGARTMKVLSAVEKESVKSR